MAGKIILSFALLNNFLIQYNLKSSLKAIHHLLHYFLCKYGRNEREKHYWGCFLSRADPESLLISLRVLLRSRASVKIGKRKEPPGRKKIAAAGIIFAIFLRCLFISFFSSLVHFSSVFRVFISSCIRPVIERTSISIASLLIMNSLLRYLLITGKPATTLEVRVRHRVTSLLEMSRVKNPYRSSY